MQGDDGGGGRVLLGVMSNPGKPQLRAQIRAEWNSRFSRSGDGVDTLFVLGTSFYANATTAPGSSAPAEIASAVRAESQASGDLLYVTGRERLPHVGVVTEKSASFWREVGTLRPGYSFYCKSDDDTLVHLDRLHAVLNHVARTEGPERPIYFGHMKWRGWDEPHKFQACGGTWGNAVKTASDILFGGKLNNGETYPPCPDAAGPYPYMSGGMVCMSSAMQKIVAADTAFRDFYIVARSRNEHGVACRRPAECASQPAAMHMWHHEDAGIGFNVFRAVVRANASASLVPVPGHFNDPGIIERSPSHQDTYWSSRAIFVHGIKERHHFDLAHKRWHLDKASDHLTLRCDRNCSSRGGADGYGWEWARLSCPVRRWSEEVQWGRWCEVKPYQHYHCCHWPWVVPELRAVLLKVLAATDGQRLSVSALIRKARKEAARSAVETPQCVGTCATVEIPGGMNMHLTLRDLAGRGDLQYSGADVLEAVPKGREREVWLVPP